MKRIAAFCFLLCCVSSVFATNRALLIGIGEYKKGTYWNKIHGDSDVELLKPLLEKKRFIVRTLTNANATKKGIINALNSLIKECKAGDKVYFHFSGHGQPMEDINGDETTIFDQTMVPFDAARVCINGYNGENHFVDDELNAYLHRLRAKVGPLGRIVVVADACHSAGGSRTYDEEVIRGTTARFELSNRPRRNYSVPNTEDWIFLSACSSEGFNRQCKVDDEWHGSLSYAIYLLSDQLRIVSAEELRSMIENTMYNLLHRTQTPVLDGPVSQIVIPIL